MSVIKELPLESEIKKFRLHITYKWNLHGGKTTMLYLNLSGHIFKKEVWHLTGKTLPNSNALPPFFKETREIDIK